MTRARQTGKFNSTLKALATYRSVLSSSILADPEFDKASLACEKQFALQQEAAAAAIRKNALLIKIKIGCSVLAIVLIGVIVTLSIQSNMRSKAIATAIEQGDYQATLKMDPSNTETLAMQKAVEMMRRDFAFHSDKVLSVAISPDGRMIASGGDDGTVKLLNVGDLLDLLKSYREKYSDSSAEEETNEN